MAIDSTSVQNQETAVVAEAEPEVVEMTDEEFIAVAKKMFKAMPDHGDYSPDTRSLMTKEFYSATVRGFDAPGTEPGGIGDEEDLYYWYTGNGGCDGKITDVKILERTAENATVKVSYKDCGDVTPHTLKLVKQGDDWLVADFDNLLSMFRSFNKKVSRLYAGDGPYKMLEYSGVDPEDEIGVDFLRQVKIYKKKYGIK